MKKMKVLGSPQKYIQGPGALNDLGKWSKVFGSVIYVILDEFVNGIAGDRIINSIDKEGIEGSLNIFNGESSMEEINRHVELAKKANANVIVGVGGGKTLDTAKAVAHLMKLPVVISPTLASTDAPTSALAIIYKPTGEFESYMHLPFNPNVVLVDTEMIVQAPWIFLSSGIGDALATYYEAKICVDADSENMAGGLSTKAAFALAELCKETLYKYGEQAIKDCKANKVTPEFEAVVEANTLLSGIGFESSGLAAAHSIHDGLTELAETHHFMHGQKVAFGSIAQAVIDEEYEELEKIVRFSLKVGLPVTLERFGIVEDVEKKIMIVANKTVDPEETIHSYPKKMTAQIVYDAIIKADKLATKIKKEVENEENNK